MSTDNPSLYQILQVDPRAEPEVIEAAYHRLALKYHPDKSILPDAVSHMQQLNGAYEILRDPQKRRQYDASLLANDHANNSYHEFTTIYNYAVPGSSDWVAAFVDDEHLVCGYSIAKSDDEGETFLIGLDINGRETFRFNCGGTGPLMSIAVLPDGTVSALDANSGFYRFDPRNRKLDYQYTCDLPQCQWDITENISLWESQTFYSSDRSRAISIFFAQGEVDQAYVWNTRSGQLIRQFNTGRHSDQNCVGITKDGQFVIFEHESQGIFTVELVRIDTGRSVKTIRTSGWFVGLSPQGNQCVCTVYESPRSYDHVIFDLSTGHQIRRVPGRHYYDNHDFFSWHSSRNAIYSSHFGTTGLEPLSIFMIDMYSGDEIARIDHPHALGDDVVISPSAIYLVSSSHALSAEVNANLNIDQGIRLLRIPTV